MAAEAQSVDVPWASAHGLSRRWNKLMTRKKFSLDTLDRRDASFAARRCGLSRSPDFGIARDRSALAAAMVTGFGQAR
jgi:hypothetical protein